MRKIHWKNLVHVLLIGAFLFLFFHVCISNSQTKTSDLMPCTFQGVYSQDGGSWMTLTEETELSALDGDLVLRGSFSQDLPHGWIVYFYANHIFYDIRVNGETVVSFKWEEGTVDPCLCARKWDYFLSPGISSQDVVEIYLSNPHQFGNAAAYSEFLSNLYPGADPNIKTSLQSMFGREYAFSKIAGLLTLMFSIGVLGIAAVFFLMKFSLAKLLWELGLFSFGMSGFILLDSMDVSLWCKHLVFNTYGQYLCIMLALLELGIYISENLKSASRRIAKIAIGAEIVFLVALFLACGTNRVLIFDTLLPWCIFQIILCSILLVCCTAEFRSSGGNRSLLLYSAALMLLSLLLDLWNGFFLWIPGVVLSKFVFLILFPIHVISGIKGISAIYQKAVGADRLIVDLNISRIMLAMSQIRTHFIFNVLNAISGMCKYDPEKADMTVVRFARYLRTNIDIMQNDQQITFHSALRHLEDYVALEQIRFGDKIQFVTDIAVDHFFLPPLVLQPIVENAIKHGLTPKPSGGTVILRTREENGTIRITIEDDGVGFHPDTLSKEGSVGLQNVRFRLHHIIHGTIDIHSIPGQGTIVTIIIPQEDTEPCT